MPFNLNYFFANKSLISTNKDSVVTLGLLASSSAILFASASAAILASSSAINCNSFLESFLPLACLALAFSTLAANNSLD
jgi:hypothetical protein